MRYHPFPGRKPLPAGETALRHKGGLAWISVLLALCLVAGMVPVFSSGVKVDAQATFSDHVIPTITDMEGVTVNLFDYWAMDDRDAENGNPTGWAGNGNDGITYVNRISEGHTLKFGSNTGDDNYSNAWDVINYSNNNTTRTTITGDIKQGIVSNTLGEDGYPVLNSETTDSSESLSYLFNPSISDSNVSGRETYTNATGLFEIDNGYYSYNSKENYAEYDDETGRFYVYDDYGVVGTTALADTSAGHFFPFDSADEVFDQYGNNLDRKNINAASEELNHLFGFTLEADFLQPENGQVTTGSQDTPMTFEFSGDDDVWVFIDGVLVMDLGGVHNSASGTINFATGDITITSQYSTKIEEYDRWSGEWTTANDSGLETHEDKYDTTIRDCFIAAGEEDSVTWASDTSNTFADNTYHTLTFFYLERGGNASNMSLQFNLNTRPVNEIVKMDEQGQALRGIQYELYAANVDADGNYTQANNTVLATLTTDSEGRAAFLDTDGQPFEFNGNGMTAGDDGKYHYILKEVNVPPGYRSTGDIWLRFDPSGGTGGQLLVSNKWETGAISNYSFVGTEYDLNWANSERQPDNSSVNNVLDNGGTMFAVVLMLTEGSGLSGSWVPLYGDNQSGWNINQPASPNADDIVTAAINAAQLQLDSGVDYVICEENTQGLWQVSLDELPGDITQYYYATTETPEDAKYIVAFYATTANSLEDATADNTWRVDTESFRREFSANIWIPNIRNQFEVEKVDANGNSIENGTVSYALYESNDVTVAADGTVTIRNDATPYDTATVNLANDSNAIFGLGGNRTGQAPLVTGQTYYLVETEAPAGYTASTDVVEIVVDSTGVHANAGEDDDDVTVKVGIGTLVKPMEKFGTNDDIDATLHDVFGALQTGTESEGSINWGAVPGESPDTETIHLTYKDDAASAGIELMSYEPTNFEGNYQQAYFTYNLGYGRMYIRQCTDGHNGATVGSDNKTDLGDQNLTNLFTGSTVVQIKNAPVTGSVTVSKTVTGLQNPGTDTFNFTIHFEEDGVNYASSVNFTTTGSATVTNGSNGIVIPSNGIVNFSLKNDASVTFTGLPQGVQYTINETTTGYTYSYATTVTDTDTEVEPDGTTFINTVAEGDQILVTYTNAADVNFSFTKVDGNSGNANTPLAGAGFTLYRWDGTGDVSEDLINTANPDANWSVVSATNTGSQSQFDFTGLYPDATYRLVETTTPDGYIAPEGQWQLTYGGGYDGWSISLVTASGNPGEAPAFSWDDDSSTLYLPNYTVPSIPVTGGEGGDWIIYGLAGTLLVGGAVLTLFGLLKKRRQG